MVPDRAGGDALHGDWNDLLGKQMKNFGAMLIAIVLLASMIYGCYWLAKTVSYKLFYESMIQSTVREMVKEGSLK